MRNVAQIDSTRKEHDARAARVVPVANPIYSTSDAQHGSRKTPRHRKRYAFAGDVFFSVPARLYDGGYASRMKPTEIVRYLTLLRVSNFDYGKEIILLSAAELELLDDIATRSAARIHVKLREMGLIEKGPSGGRAIVLVHPWRWPDLHGPKPRLSRPGGELVCSCE